jgi:ABC-type bacteriocin/lantibiotic exporter with double-glycine peptidase domain
MSLPAELNTPIERAEGNFSAGQLQHLALAHALFHAKPVMILDEAKNAVDIKTEDKVFENFKRFLEQHLLIGMSHSSSSLSHCNCRYRLEYGRLVREVSDMRGLILKSH